MNVHLKELVQKFSNAKILVIGDIMVDEYIWGDVERISPEAPVPVVTVNSESVMLGGATNVVNNIHALTGKVYIAGVIGDDDIGRTVSAILHRKNLCTDGIIVDKSRRTTLKTRVIAHNQQVVRVDREHRFNIHDDVLDKLTAYMTETIPNVDAVIISDYAKGVVTRQLVKAVVDLVRKHNKICCVDPKVTHFNHYKGVNVITPNHHEAAQATQMSVHDMDSVKIAGERIKELTECDAVVITFGERGMCVFDKDGDFTHIDTVAKKVYDVTGAGDTVISTLTLALSVGATLMEAALLANHAAGLVVEQFGTSTITQGELLERIEK